MVIMYVYNDWVPVLILLHNLRTILGIYIIATPYMVNTFINNSIALVLR